MNEAKLKCRRCGGVFPVSQIRMDSVSKGYICTDCLRVADHLSSPTKMTSTTEMDKLRKKRKAQREQKTEFITYCCQTCKYKTRFSSDKIPKTCSYCGKKVDLEMNQEMDINSLIRDVEDSGIFGKR